MAKKYHCAQPKKCLILIERRRSIYADTVVNDSYVCECFKNVSTLRRINFDCRAGDFGSHCTNSQLCIKGSLTRGTSSRAWTFVYQTIPIYQGYYSQFIVKTMFLELSELISASASIWIQNTKYKISIQYKYRMYLIFQFDMYTDNNDMKLYLNVVSFFISTRLKDITATC